QPHFNSGFHEPARTLARHTIAAFAGSSLVVTPSGSCAAMVKHEYPELFHGDPAWHARAVELAGRTHELSDFLVNVLGTVDVDAVVATDAGCLMNIGGCLHRRRSGVRILHLAELLAQT